MLFSVEAVEGSKAEKKSQGCITRRPNWDNNIMSTRREQLCTLLTLTCLRLSKQ